MSNSGIILIMALSVTVLVTSCFMDTHEEHMKHPLYPSLLQLQKELPLLDLSSAPEASPSFDAYCNYYHLNFKDTTHFWGSFSSGAYQLAAHVFLPKEARGTVFLLHGYLDHTGMLAPLIQNCLEQQFIVAVYDLPGHGLSSGDRASIGDFNEYVDVFRDFLAYCQTYLPPPYHVICHSTGSSIALEFLTQHADQPFGGVIFLAPLVHHNFWTLSKVGYILGKPLRLKTVPRRGSVPSSNPDFAKFAKQDPLQTSRVPLHWVGEVYEWNKDIHKMNRLRLPLLIIQGTDDSVVDWEYNIPFLQEKIEGVSVKLIKNAEHQLIYEPLTIRKEVFRDINEYLEEHS